MPVVLASLPELIIALVLMLILWGARALFGGMISSLASRIPLLGSVVATLADAVISDSIRAAQVLAQEAIGKAEGLILGPVFWFEHLIASIWDTLDALRAMLAYVARVMIQQGVAIAIAEARVLIARSESAIMTAVNADFAYLRGEIAQVYATITTVEHALEAYTQELVAAAEAYTTRAIAAETAYVTAGLQAAQSEITTAIAAQSAYITAETDASIAYTRAAIASLEGAITADTSAITAWVTGQVVSLTAAIDMVQAATVAVTLGAVRAVETDLGNLKTECTDNLCSGVGGLASLFNSLFDTAALAGLVAYAAWMGTEPQAAGHATADVVGPVASVAVDGAHAALGAL
jgi:hypothetical protein